MTLRALMILAACCLMPASQALAADAYPSRTVKIIGPFAAAGPTDIVARLIAKGLSERLKQQFFVENLPGAGGNIGAAAAAKAPADGYTLLLVASSFVVNPTLYAHIPFDARKDFAPVMMVGDGPNVLIVNPSLPAKDIKAFVALIKAHPGKYSFASAGVGTTTHLSGELMKSTLGLDMVHVPFTGSGPAMQSVLGGYTPIAFTTIPPAMAFIKDGKVRVLAVLSKERAPSLPGVPTMEEAGYPGQEGDNFQGLLVPAGTPQPIIQHLHDEVAAIVNAPDIKRRFQALGLDVVANTPAQFARQIDAQIAKWGGVIKAAHLKIE
jgi:tripartite-type tricarboxylate transporter receptor subunit TctC